MSLRLLLLILLLGPLVARADVPGIDLYERGEYEVAVRVLKEEANDRRNPEAQRARARLYLAASMFALGMEFEARQELKELARRHPEQRVDPALFPPELVELEKKARAEVKAEPAQPPSAPDAETPSTDVEASSPWRLRPEATGFVDVVDRRSWGLTAGLTLGGGPLEGSARVVLGRQVGVELEAGYLFGTGVFQPRVAVRGTSVPGLELWGGGAVVGGRLALSPRLTALVDVGAEYFSARTGYEQFVLVASVGLGFNLFSP
jgi:tetratricopeptide (TPR) repeat protein